MDWNVGWIFWGGLAFLLGSVNLLRAFLGKGKGWQVLLFGSLTCGVLALFTGYRWMVQCLRWGELAAVERVVPAMTEILQAAVPLGLALNLAALLMCLKNFPDIHKKFLKNRETKCTASSSYLIEPCNRTVNQTGETL